MLKTISLGTSVLIQGAFVRNLPDGRVTVSVDGTEYSGKPVQAAA